MAENAPAEPVASPLKPKLKERSCMKPHVADALLLGLTNPWPVAHQGPIACVLGTMSCAGLKPGRRD